jgi:hypothetical protein
MCISELCLHLHLTRLLRSKSLKLCEKLIGVYKTGRMLKRGIGSFTNPEETAIWIYIVFCLLLWFQTAGSEILFNERRAFIHRYALCFCKFLTAFLSGCKPTDFSHVSYILELLLSFSVTLTLQNVSDFHIDFGGSSVWYHVLWV